MSIYIHTTTTTVGSMPDAYPKGRPVKRLLFATDEILVAHEVSRVALVYV